MFWRICQNDLGDRKTRASSFFSAAVPLWEIAWFDEVGIRCSYTPTLPRKADHTTDRTAGARRDAACAVRVAGTASGAALRAGRRAPAVRRGAAGHVRACSDGGWADGASDDAAAAAELPSPLFSATHSLEPGERGGLWTPTFSSGSMGSADALAHIGLVGGMMASTS